jgi:transcriptional regulator with XRE-family HTH domain
MHPVRQLRAIAGLTQAQLAGASGTSQPTIAAYESGAKSPTVRTLRALAAGVGLEAVVRFVPPLTREDRRSLAVHEAIAGRLLADPDGTVGRARRLLASLRSQHPGARRLLDEWRAVLERPVDEIVEVLRDPGLHARDLRQVTPFAGVLLPAERTQVYRRFRKEEAA